MTMAQTVVWLPLAQISQTMVKATFPVFSKLQNEPARARSALYRRRAPSACCHSRCWPVSAPWRAS